MNATSAVAAGGLTGNLATCIVWISNSLANGVWFPVDSGTSIALTSLISAGATALGITSWRRATKDKSSATETITVETSKI